MPVAVEQVPLSLQPVVTVLQAARQVLVLAHWPSVPHVAVTVSLEYLHVPWQTDPAAAPA